jgi:hypothetical protein
VSTELASNFASGVSQPMSGRRAPAPVERLRRASARRRIICSLR